VEVPDASHIMHEDNPQVVNEAIAEFLSGTTDGT
jgi:pimeloyl-ACP methyl ester carboxylesterase